MHVLLIAFLFSSLAPAYSQRDLQFHKLSSIRFPGTDIVSIRKPVVYYPYVHIPDSYGFMVCQWDSQEAVTTGLTTGVFAQVNTG